MEEEGPHEMEVAQEEKEEDEEENETKSGRAVGKLNSFSYFLIS